MSQAPDLEMQILDHYLVDKLRVNTIARQLSVHHTVVQRVLAQASAHPLKPQSQLSKAGNYLPVIRQTLETFPTLTASRLHKIVVGRGYSGGPSYFRHLVACLRPRFDASEWMLALLQRRIDVDVLKQQTANLPELGIFLNRLYNGKLSERNKSLAILAFRRGLKIETISALLGISTNTYCSYKRIFLTGGAQALFAPKSYPARKRDGEPLKNAIFKVLHEPPSNYGVNRTTWTMALLRKVLSETGNGACPEVIRRVTRAAGYRWRKARVVLTSADPTYSEKLGRIHSILSNLQPNEAFFSIDEYGPFAVKVRGGRKLTAPGEQYVVPQWQKSRGSLILTAALELSGNQVTHFYSSRKNTGEMIRMMDILITKYADRRRFYLSWDAASWHVSKELNQRIVAHNCQVAERGGVVVEAAPLPAGAQFLNVIESVFSGMSRAIIHSSDYPSLDDAKAAIDRHFGERNDYFNKHPHRAGKKIWGKEREPATFSESANCKDPRYR
jgi:transposase